MAESTNFTESFISYEKKTVMLAMEKLLTQGLREKMTRVLESIFYYPNISTYQITD